MDLKIKKLRDPFILRANDTYYAYGTGVNNDNTWTNTTYACYKAVDGTLDGKWELIDGIYECPSDSVSNYWAPEVHKYGDYYYLIATYRSASTAHKGVTIMRSASPEGTFKEITCGHVTPKEWDCIDGTLYIDRKGEPWLVFVHEWTCTDDGVGRMAAMRLSDDLTHAVSKPIELFRADEPDWACGNRVTDGCFMQRLGNGKLVMLWSNFCDDGYCEGIAESDNGEIDGKWLHHSELLYKKGIHGEYDGGHGMIFSDYDGNEYLCLHSPNTPTKEREEVPMILPVSEESGKLILKKEM